jgi:hypothetical protein
MMLRLVADSSSELLCELMVVLHDSFLSCPRHQSAGPRRVVLANTRLSRRSLPCTLEIFVRRSIESRDLSERQSDRAGLFRHDLVVARIDLDEEFSQRDERGSSVVTGILIRARNAIGCNLCLTPVPRRLLLE